MAFHPLSLLGILVILAAIGLIAARRVAPAVALIVANVILFLLTEFGPTSVVETTFGERTVSTVRWELGLHGAALAAGQATAFLQLLTSMFVHGGPGHLIGNMLMLYFFATPFEERIGDRPFLAIYLVTGIAAAMTQVATAWGEEMLLVGASGAVFGVIGAFAAAYPRLVVPLPVPIIVIVFIRMRVWIAAVVFGTLQFFYLATISQFDNTAYAAHLGGLAAGILAGWVVARLTPRSARIVIDLARLEPFVHGIGTEAALAQMRLNQDERTVFLAWLDRFFQGARCPTCGSGVRPHRHEVVCQQGHRFDVRQTAPLRS